MGAACHPSMRTWERFSVHTCPEGLGPWLLVPGPGVSWGWVCSGSAPWRPVCREWHSCGRCGCQRVPCSGAGSAATPDQLAGPPCRCCSGSLSDQPAGLGCPLRCMGDCLLSVSKSIFIQNYFNIKICVSE